MIVPTSHWGCPKEKGTINDKKERLVKTRIAVEFIKGKLRVDIF